MSLSLGAFGLLLIALILNLSLGSHTIPPHDLFHAIFSPLGNSANWELNRTILFEIRLPRIIIGALSGGSLAAAGVLCQGLFRNSLASPSVLGTSAGGTFAAVLVFYLGWGNSIHYTLPLAAVFGSLITTIIVLRLCRSPVGYKIENILLLGFTLNALFSALSSLIVSISLEDYQRTPVILKWMMGSLSAKGVEHLYYATLPLAFAFLYADRLAGGLDVMSLGDELASSLSIDPQTFRWKVVAVISVLVGVAVAMAGTLPFVGLIVPHMTRLVFGPHHRKLFRLSIINGMSLVLFTDLLARSIISPREIEVGIIITLIGAPLFAFLLIKHSQRSAL